MGRALHVVFDGEVFKPLEPVDLKPNTHCVVRVEEEEQSVEKDVWDVLSELAGTVEAPEDWAEEHDHYLYGTPKSRER